MTSASLTFLGSPDLVFSGVDDTNPLGLISMPDVPMATRVTYADDSAHVEGSVATAAVWQQTTLTAVVGLKGTDQATLEAQKAALRSAVGQFRYAVVTERNGYEQSWTADMGSMTPASDDDFIELRDFEAGYTLSIPVRPTAAVV